MNSNPILQPILVGFILVLVTHLISGRIPIRAQKKVIDEGGTKEEGLAAFKEKDMALYLESRITALGAGWSVLGFILAIMGSYPQVAVTLSWVLVVSVFVFKLVQMLVMNTKPDSKFSILAVFAFPAILAMLISLGLLIIITIQVVF